MLRFIFRRLLSLIPLLFCISVLTVFLTCLAPGDALTELRARPDIPPQLVARLERQYGYVDAQGQRNPWTVRYLYWLNTVSPLKFLNDKGDFEWAWKPKDVSLGESIAYRVPVTDLLSQRVKATLALDIAALLLAWGLAIPLGILAAIKKDSWADRLTAIFAYGALSVPEYFLGILFILMAAKTGWFPIGGRASFDYDFLSPSAQFGDLAWHLVLPTIVLGVGGVASMMRIMRTSMLDYLRAEFVTTARAKGVPEGRVMFFHVLRNAINPMITTFGFAFASLLSGAMLVEYVMNYPGLGRLVYDSLLRRDEYVVMAAVLVGAIMLVLGNLLADILLAWSDPRIRLEKSGSTGPMKRRGSTTALLAGLVVAVVMVVDLWCLPSGSPKAMGLVVEKMKIAMAVVLLAAGVILVRISWPVLSKLFKSLRRSPLTAAAVFCLIVLYIGAVFAPFFAVKQTGDINLARTFHPPSRVVWKDGRLWAQLYENVYPPAAQYEPIKDALLPLSFFGHGYAYNLLDFFGVDRQQLDAAPPGWWSGFLRLFNTDRHFLVPDYEAMAKVRGEPANPNDFAFYPLGSDPTGRDVYSRLLYGGRISLTIGLVGIGITMTMGFIIGGLAGYFGGAFDFWSMRLVEFLMAVPSLYLLLALRAALAPYFEPAEIYLVIIVILSLIGWAGAARVLRGMSLSLRERTFVTAAECLGQSTWNILFKHLLPNLAGYLLVAATLSIPGYILGEAALSFLGLGIEDPSASWGLMLSQAQDMKVMMLGFWWMLLPGLAIFVTVMSFNIVGDALRDIVDPKMKTH